MRRQRSVRTLIHKQGSQVDVLERQTTGDDAFNNPQSEWSEVGTTRCVRTYPNRNTQLDERGGPFERDRPMFLFSTGEEPSSGARIRYEGKLYEMKAPTVYDTHVAMFGNRVNND